MSERRPLTLVETSEHLLAALEGGERVAIIAIVAHPDPTKTGNRILVRGKVQVGSFQDATADEAAVGWAMEGLSGNPKVLPGLHPLPLTGGGEATAYLELHHPPQEMVIVGAGHLAQPLCTLGALLGLRVRVLDDRPEFATRERFPEAHEVRRVDFSDPFAGGKLHLWSHVVLVTRGHRYDFECLRKVLQHVPLPGYVGMIGSRRRVRATFEALLEEGFSRELLSQVRAPIGLDIRGETPAEIAVSVAAEIVHLWRGGSGRPLREAERVLDRLTSGGSEGPATSPGMEGTP